MTWDNENQTRNITHYHFTGWEDWKLPSGQSRAELCQLITNVATEFVMENAKKTGTDRLRLLIHCRAGVGRTGTTIALIHATICILD